MYYAIRNKNDGMLLSIDSAIVWDDLGVVITFKNEYQEKFIEIKSDVELEIIKLSFCNPEVIV